MHKVLIHPADYDNCRQAVERAFELFPVEVRGKKVLLKPNVLRTAKAEEAITTHPAVLRAVLDHVETMGPAEIVGGRQPRVVQLRGQRSRFSRMRPAERLPRLLS